MKLSVTARLALLAFGLILVSNLALVALVWNQIHNNAMSTLRRDTLEQSDVFAGLVHSGGPTAIAKAVSDAYGRGDDALIAMVVDGEGRRLAGRGPSTADIAPVEFTTFRIIRIANGPPWFRREAGIAIRPVGRYWLVSGRLLDDWQQEQRAIERALALAALLSLVLGCIGGLVLTRYVTRRLDRVAGVVEAVAGGDLSRRVDLAAAGGDAFDRLAARLNAMLDKIERLMTELRVMTDSVAHDLRSPLARLRSKAESAMTQADPAARDAALGGLIAETDIVMRMLTMLLEIGRSEAVSRDRLITIHPADLVEEIADLYAPVAEEAGMRFSVETDGIPLPMALHRELMSQAITNLIDNALNHASEGGSITLRLLAGLESLQFQVEDRGPGIAEADHDQARRRFGRLDGARTTPGAGLGLALVEAVARLHGGHLALADNQPGLIAAIIIPLSAADAFG